MRKAIFPGTFDPFTIGHYSVVERALTFMDEIIIGIGINENKNTYFPIEKREEMIRNLYKDNPRIKVMSYDCLTIDFAQQVEAQFIVRGIRTVKDFEYEETIADINRKLAGIETGTDLRQLNDCTRAADLQQRYQPVYPRRNGDKLKVGSISIEADFKVSLRGMKIVWITQR